MTENDPVCIATYSDEMSAEVARAALESNGIYAFVSKDDCGGMRPHWQLTIGVRLMIRKADAEVAAEILQQAGSAM